MGLFDRIKKLISQPATDSVLPSNADDYNFTVDYTPVPPKTTPTQETYPSVSIPGKYGWEKWPEFLHSDPDQVKRQKSALGIELTPVELNKVEETAIFDGSESRYFTSLDSCQCIDFCRRQRPCKHMYRLAMEVGAFPGLEDTKSLAPEDICKERWDLDYILSLISDFTPTEKQDFAHICINCGIYNQNGPTETTKKLAGKLVKLGLVTKIEDVEKTLHNFTKADLMLLFSSYGLKSSMKKQEMIDVLKDKISFKDIPSKYKKAEVLLDHRIWRDAERIFRAIRVKNVY